MSHKLDLQRLEHAFQDRPDLVGAIQQAATAPNWIELFNEITLYVAELQNPNPSGPALKKRKRDEATLSTNSIPNGTSNTNRNGTAVLAINDERPTLLQVKDISLVIPQRKRYTLEFTAAHIRARHPDTNELIHGISYAWKDITFAFRLPIPEKAQKQYNYVLFPKSSNLPASQGGPSVEPLVFTISPTAPRPGTISGTYASAASAVSDDYKSLFDWALSRGFKEAGNSLAIIEADEKHFSSVMKEAHRPNEKAVFVKGFRGSKDGYLFFLRTGILWGFKKPLLFLPKERIAAVSYTSVLQRTFNLNVELYASNGDTKGGDAAVAGEEEEEEKEEFEFAMLDQEDFAGIDTYVKRHGLQDASMAEQRRAKRLGINVVKGEDGQKVDVGDVGELEKAEAELQDEEDEEEEDYDPGSEGESEGEGSSSDEEDGDGDDVNNGQDGEEELEDDEDDEDDRVEDP